jgi:hypothetical protein
MVARLPYPDEKDHPDPRSELDVPLMVNTWHVPGEQRPDVEGETVEGAPSWWRGDEEASQSFIREMGIKL